MKNTYKKVKLIEIAELNSRQIDKNFTYKYIQYIDVSSVTKGSINNIQYLKATEAPSRAKRLVEKNDILYSTVRPNLEHYVFIKEDLEANTVASTGFVVITPKKGFVDPYYLHCLITRPQYTQYLSQIAEQAVSTYPTITPNVMADLELTLPPLSEQKRIANILSSFDNKIEILKKENKILEDIAENIFKEWFIKYNFPNKDGKPYKDNGGQMIDSELGPIPEGWGVGSIYEICNILYGYPFNSKLFSEETGFPLIRIRNLADSSINTFTTEDYDEKYITQAGDILVGMDGDFIITRWYSKNALLNQRICKLEPQKDVSKSYILYITKPYIGLLQKTNFGTTVAHLGKSDWDRFRALIPNKNIFLKYNKLSNTLEKKMINNHKNIHNLTKQKDILIKKLIK